MLRCMRRTNIYLEERQTKALDRIASDEGVTRAEVIRRLIDRSLAGSTGRDELASAIDASFGALAGSETAPVIRRQSDDRQAYLESEWRR